MELDKTFGKPLETVKYIPRPSSYCVIFNDAMEFCCAKTPLGFFLPGGGIESNESPKDALRRELLEEFGWEIDIKDYICSSGEYYLSPTYKKYFLSEGYFYFAKETGIRHTPIEKDHTPTWLKKENINMLYHDFQKWAVNKAYEQY